MLAHLLIKLGERLRRLSTLDRGSKTLFDTFHRAALQVQLLREGRRQAGAAWDQGARDFAAARSGPVPELVGAQCDAQR